MRLFLVLVALLAPAEAEENIALGKKTFQSSLSAGGVSSRAVDGNTDPDYHHHSCTHTKGYVNSWWAVDLQYAHRIKRVDITNRKGCCHSRLKHIRIGTTDVDPAVTPPTISSIQICASQDKPVGAGVTQSFYCGATGRYVVVMLEKKTILTLCEVQVFGVEKKCNEDLLAAEKAAQTALTNLLSKVNEICAQNDDLNEGIEEKQAALEEALRRNKELTAEKEELGQAVVNASPLPLPEPQKQAESVIQPEALKSQ